MTAVTANEILAQACLAGRVCAFAASLAGIVAIDAAAGGAFAQAPVPAPAVEAKSTEGGEAKPSATSSIEDVIKKHEQELEQARNRQRDAIEAENKLKAEI